MPKFTFKFHFEKKPDEIINWNDSDHISQPFKDYSRKINENKEDLIFYYKGSSFKYQDCEKNSLFKNEMFSEINPNKTINIIAFPLRKTKKHPPALKLSIENKVQNALVPLNQIKNEEIKTAPKQNEKASSSISNIEEKIRKPTEIEKQYFNDILCPYCLTTSIIENDGIKLNIINCENFHRISNITYDRFEEVDTFPNAKCGACSVYKSQYDTPGVKFYNCSCGIYLCPECYTRHKNHIKIELENKNYHCLIHDKNFKSYCLDCNKNLCESCSDSHPKEHEVLLYFALKPKEDYIRNLNQEVEKQKKVLDEFIKNLEKLFDDIKNEIKTYVNDYILIEKTLLNRYNKNSVNFQIIQNIRNKKIFYENTIFKSLNDFNGIDKSNMLDSLKNIYSIYYKIDITKKEQKIIEDLPKAKSQNEMTIKYKFNKDRINKNVKLFDSIFVDNNRDKLTLLVNGKEEKQLIEYYNNASNIEDLNVTIKEKKSVTNMSYMFNNCKDLVSIDTKNWDTTNITNMESLFQLCPFEAIPDISLWKTPNLKNMKAMFSKCISLKSMPEMAKWNTNNVTDMSLLFNGCISIEAIPKFPIWNTQNVEDMSYMFSRCKKLNNLHNIGKLSTVKVKNMCGIFNRCEELSPLPDISKWNTSNVEDISIIFQFCSKLEQFPDNLYKWNLGKVKDMSGVFSECSNVKKLPNIGRWNPPLVESMCGLFNGCTSLTEIPDISKWNTSNVTDMSGMFCDCEELTKIPNLSGWKTSNVTDMSYMFENCKKLKDISSIKGWDIKKVTNKTDAFEGCTEIKKNKDDEWFTKI